MVSRLLRPPAAAAERALTPERHLHPQRSQKGSRAARHLDQCRPNPLLPSPPSLTSLLAYGQPPSSNPIHLNPLTSELRRTPSHQASPPFNCTAQLCPPHITPPLLCPFPPLLLSFAPTPPLPSFTPPPSHPSSTHPPGSKDWPLLWIAVELLRAPLPVGCTVNIPPRTPTPGGEVSQWPAYEPRFTYGGREVGEHPFTPALFKEAQRMRVRLRMRMRYYRKLESVSHGLGGR